MKKEKRFVTSLPLSRKATNKISKFKGLVIIDDDPIKNLDFHENADDTSSKASSVTSRTRSSFSRKPRPPPRARKHSPVRGDDPDDESDLSSVTTSSQSAKVIVDKNKNEKDAEKKEAEKKSTFKWAKYNNLTINSPDLTNHHYMLFFPYIMGFAVLIKKWSKLISGSSLGQNANID